MKKILKYSLLVILSSVLLYIASVYILLWFEDRGLQAERMEKLIEITGNLEFRCMTVLYYEGTNSSEVRDNNGSNFIFFSSRPPPRFSGIPPPLEMEAKSDIGELMRSILSRKIGTDIGELQGSLSYFTYRTQGHQLEISVNETKNGFYIETKDIWFEN